MMPARLGRIVGAKWVIVLEAYLDSSRAYAQSKRRLFSGDLEDRKTYSLVGYIGRTEAWGQFDGEWIARLQQDGLNTFHMTDLLAGKLPFEGWNVERARPLIADLIKIVNDHALFGFGCVVPLQDIEERPTPYVVCLHQCLEIILRQGQLLSIPPDEPIALLLDWEHGVRGAAEQHLEKLKHASGPNASPWQRFTALSFVLQKNAEIIPGFIGIPALQAADLVAFEHMASEHQHRPPDEERVRHSEIEGIPFESWVLDRTLFDLFAVQVRRHSGAIET